MGLDTSKYFVSSYDEHVWSAMELKYRFLLACHFENDVKPEVHPNVKSDDWRSNFHYMGRSKE